MKKKENSKSAYPQRKRFYQNTKIRVPKTPETPKLPK
jgi:hypothetical protein